MTILKLLSVLRKQNIKLWAEGNQLRYSVPPGSELSADFLAQLTERKAEILAFLDEADKNKKLVPPPIKPAPPSKRNGEMPLSYAQERLWFIDQLQPGSAAYNVAGALWMKGVLKVEQLERAINEIIRRHEVLRTTFTMSGGGRPVQVIHEYQWGDLTMVDLSDLPLGEQSAR